MARGSKRGIRLPVLRTRLVPLFLRRARRLGAKVGDICERYEIPLEPEGEDVSMGVAAFRAFADDIAERTGDDLFGFHAALETPRGAYGALEYFARNTPTAREVVQALVQYGRSINNQVRITFDAQTGRITETIPGSLECLGRHGNDFAVTHKVKIGRELLDPKLTPRRIFFAHAAPAEQRELRAYFDGSELVYGAEFNGVELDPALLANRVDQADPALRRLLEERVVGAARAIESTDPLAELRRAVAEDLAAADVNGELLATRLGVSKRTLHRRLADAGVSLRALIDDVRREVAVACLADADRPLGDIALRLGYSDARAFARAFQRWTGKTPASYRSTVRMRT